MLYIRYHLDKQCTTLAVDGNKYIYPLVCLLLAGKKNYIRLSFKIDLCYIIEWTKYVINKKFPKLLSVIWKVVRNINTAWNGYTASAHTKDGVFTC